MLLFSAILLLTALTDPISCRVHHTACPHVCVCTGTSAKCDMHDHTLSTVLRTLSKNITELDISRSGLTYLKPGTFRKFNNLQFLSLAENSIEILLEGSLQGLGRLKELHLQKNGKAFTVEDKVFQDTPLLERVRLEENPSITSLGFLRTLRKLRKVRADSEKSCSRCNFSKVSAKEYCPSPGRCIEPRESPFGNGNCACAMCVLNASQNCSEDQLLGPRLLGDNTAVRVTLWLISSLALLSNLALVAARCYKRTLRLKPLSIFVAGIAFSNLFVIASVLILLVADSNQFPSGLTGQRIWCDSICGPAYFLKHFGIYSLVFILTFVVMDRFVRLGYHRCLKSQLTVRRSVVYVCEAWVLSFLLIIMPWTRVTTWHRMCTASHETIIAQVMYFISTVLFIGLCFFCVVHVAVLFWRHILTDKLGVRKDALADMGLVLAVVLTFMFLAIPHGVLAISHFVATTSPETGGEIVTILLTLLCALYPVLLARYYQTVTCLGETLTSSDTSCTCGKCKTEQFCPTKFSMDCQHPPISTNVTLASFQTGSSSQKRSETMTSSLSVERMSIDSVIELDTWNSRSTKTKSWIEACDYDDLKKLGAQSRFQTAKVYSGFQEVRPKTRELTLSNGNVRNSTSTSGVNDVFSGGSVSTSSEPTSSFHEAIHENAIIGPVPHDELTRNRDDSDCGRASDSSRKSKRLSSIKELLQRALSPRRQRSKSLPENREVREKKVERSQSMPVSAITLDKNLPAPMNGTFESSHSGVVIRENPEGLPSDGSRPQEMLRENKCTERLASFFVLAPAKSPNISRKTLFSPRKAKNGDASSPSNTHKSSIADRIAKSFSLGRKSPASDEQHSPVKTITLEEGDILTELPVMRRKQVKTRPRDATARHSTGSTGSTGSTANRFSLEWDPIGSVEGYAEREVLPPYPPRSLNDHGGAPPKFPRSLSERQAPQGPSGDNLPERTSSYSLDWDPTSVQLRNSMISRESVSLGDFSDDEGSLKDISYQKDMNGTTVWV